MGPVFMCFIQKVYAVSSQNSKNVNILLKKE